MTANPLQSPQAEGGLLPCPFDGSKARLHDYGYIQGTDNAFVECETCGVSIEGDGGTPDAATAAWNRRASSSGLAGEAVAKPLDDDTHAFKNFHRLLCERFGYSHDEVDWRRDQVSLIEWIASRARQRADLLESLSNWLDPEIGFPNDDLLRRVHLDVELRGRKDAAFAVSVHHRSIVLSAVANALRNSHLSWNEWADKCAHPPERAAVPPSIPAGGVSEALEDGPQRALDIIDKHIREQTSGACCDNCWCQALRYAREEIAALATLSLPAGGVAVSDAWQGMETAPKDGTYVLLWMVHQNAKYSADPVEEGWEAPVVAKWIDHNGGGWTWHGLCGQPARWMPFPMLEAALSPEAKTGERS